MNFAFRVEENHAVESIQYDVDIDLANEIKAEMKTIIGAGSNNVLSKMTDFSAMLELSGQYRHPVLVLKTEEPGSKQILASKYGRLANVAYDMIHHLINDCICMGATPLSVQDAIICGKIDKDDIKTLVDAMARCCEEQGCRLTGGETSEQPGVLPEKTYILTSSIVGVVEKDSIIDGTSVRPDDVVLALESSGIHTNGYTLVRKIMEKYPGIVKESVGGMSFIDSILTPHRCYYRAISDLFPLRIIKGIAHITGGGIRENLNRILPANMDAELWADRYNILPIFQLLRRYGNISDQEMLRTFNLGVGMTIITAPENAEKVTAHIMDRGIGCYPIGRIVGGEQNVKIIGKFIWESGSALEGNE